jgi:flagellar biosynthesis component FlhA
MFYQAGFISFIRTIAIIIGVMYIFRFLARIFFPVLLKRYMAKQQNHQQNHSNQQARQQTKSQQKQTEEKHISDELGEYVDYEEVE